VTDHRCALGELTVKIARAVGDGASATAGALTDMLVEGRFESCCVPRYLALAPEYAEREVQVPIAKVGTVETRVIVWPVGSRDFTHPHSKGWTVFVPVLGELTEIASSDGEAASAIVLPPRRPQVLRPEDGVRHRVQNRSDAVALSIHVSGLR
jgi:hypothetical protein